jgi:hypothetical protein
VPNGTRYGAGIWCNEEQTKGRHLLLPNVAQNEFHILLEAPKMDRPTAAAYAVHRAQEAISGNSSTSASHMITAVKGRVQWSVDFARETARPSKPQH